MFPLFNTCNEPCSPDLLWSSQHREIQMRGRGGNEVQCSVNSLMPTVLLAWSAHASKTTSGCKGVDRVKGEWYNKCLVCVNPSVGVCSSVCFVLSVCGLWLSPVSVRVLEVFFVYLLCQWESVLLAVLSPLAERLREPGHLVHQELFLQQPPLLVWERHLQLNA